MWSLIPGPIRRYRRQHPYNHPMLYFFMDLIDSSLKLLLLCGVAIAGYVAVKNYTGHNPVSQIATATTTEPAQSDIELPLTQQTTVVTASAVRGTVNATTDIRTKRLLDNTPGILWINSLPDTHYVIQFASSVDKPTLIAFANNHLQKGAVIFPFKITADKQTMYGVASGLYETMDSAMQAIERFPQALRQHQPWIRPVASLQKQVAVASRRLN